MADEQDKAFITQCLNMALGSQTEGETSYSNSFDVKVGKEGFLFIPRLPSSYVIDDALYQKIFLIANAALYPRYTVLKQNSAYFIPLIQRIFTFNVLSFSHGKWELVSA